MRLEGLLIRIRIYLHLHLHLRLLAVRLITTLTALDAIKTKPTSAVTTVPV